MLYPPVFGADDAIKSMRDNSPMPLYRLSSSLSRFLEKQLQDSCFGDTRRAGEGK
jgi:hypothetical protein